MNISLTLTEIEMIVTTFISAFVAHEFYKSKNGRLRVLMIIYFTSISVMYGLAGIYYFLQAEKWFVMNEGLFRILVNFPKTVVMLMLYSYLRVRKQ